MSFTKVSLSLSSDDLAYLDSEAVAGRFRSRSAAVQAAVRLLRESALEDAYAAAYGEWNADPDAPLWDGVTADGVA